MNTLESFTITSPYDKEEECAKFTIDTLTNQFVLHDIAVVNQQYVFSGWIKSDEAGIVRVGEKSFVTSTEWERQTVTFTAMKKDVAISFSVVGVYYIYHPKLEIGNKATDWTPAPEDVDEKIDNVVTELGSTNERVEIAETQIESTKKEISLRATVDYVDTTVRDVVDGYVQKTVFEEYQKSNEAELSVMADKVEIAVSETMRQEIKAGDDELMSLYQELRMNYDFTADGQYIGKKDSDTMMRLVNDMMQILVAGVAATTVDRDGLTSEQANIKTMHIGDYTLALGEDNHLTLT